MASNPPFISHEKAIWKGSHNPIFFWDENWLWFLTTYVRHGMFPQVDSPPEPEPPESHGDHSLLGGFRPLDGFFGWSPWCSLSRHLLFGCTLARGPKQNYRCWFETGLFFFFALNLGEWSNLINILICFKGVGPINWKWAPKFRHFLLEGKFQSGGASKRAKSRKWRIQSFWNPSLPNTRWVGIPTLKHLLKRPLGCPNISSQGIGSFWKIRESL